LVLSFKSFPFSTLAYFLPITLSCNACDSLSLKHSITICLPCLMSSTSSFLHYFLLPFAPLSYSFLIRH
jgi:hypothetical protein